MKRALIVACLALSACATQSPDDTTVGQELIDDQTMYGNYSAIATCVYLDASRNFPGVVKSDLPDAKQTRISYDSSGVRYWELILDGAGQNMTRVRFTAFRTMWGAFRGRNDAFSSAKACSDGITRPQKRTS